MEDKIKQAIESLAKRAESAATNEVLHISQATLNLVHALSILRQEYKPV